MIVARLANQPLTTSFYTVTVKYIPFLLLFATPSLATDNGHTGTATARTAPELSDLALFVMAATGIWFTRRAMRRRVRKD